MDHDEELALAMGIARTRLGDRARVDELFDGKSAEARRRDTALVRKLFVQADAVITTKNLELEKQASASSPAPAVDAFFEKVAREQITEAQRRYPELLKVAFPKVPPTAIRKQTSPVIGEVPAKSALSGGSA